MVTQRNNGEISRFIIVGARRQIMPGRGDDNLSPRGPRHCDADFRWAAGHVLLLCMLSDFQGHDDSYRIGYFPHDVYQFGHLFPDCKDDGAIDVDGYHNSHPNSKYYLYADEYHCDKFDEYAI
jgi:hypothetical protein